MSAVERLIIMKDAAASAAEEAARDGVGITQEGFEAGLRRTLTHSFVRSFVHSLNVKRRRFTSWVLIKTWCIRSTDVGT